jgi:hypothetical protein
MAGSCLVGCGAFRLRGPNLLVVMCLVFLGCGTCVALCFCFVEMVCGGVIVAGSFRLRALFASGMGSTLEIKHHPVLALMMMMLMVVMVVMVMMMMVLVVHLCCCSSSVLLSELCTLLKKKEKTHTRSRPGLRGPARGLLRCGH